MLGHPGVALGEHDEGAEEVLPVFGGGGQVAADRAELGGSGEGAQAAGHLLPELDHADVALGAVVVRWYPRVAGEAQVVVRAVAQPPSKRVVLAHQLPGPRRGLGEANLRGPGRAPDPWQELTGQEAEIARLAAARRTNSEIGAQLFLSPRTVEWHLGKIFAK